MSAPENPYAFPVIYYDGSAPCQGMTLRDWFAGQALAGFLADGSQRKAAAAVAIGVYALADAMLAARGAAQ